MITIYVYSEDDKKLEETITKSNVNHIVIKIKKMVEDFKNNEN